MPYLALIEADGAAHGGLVPELNVAATGKNRDEVLERLAQGITLALKERGLPLNASASQYQERSDVPADLLADFQDAEVVMIDPAVMNPTSLQVEQAIAQSGLRPSEVARRMGTSPSSVHRLVDPFYWGHSEASLRKLAHVLGLSLLMEFETPLDLPAGTILSYHWGGTQAPQVRVRNVPELEGAEFPLTVRSEFGTFRLSRRSEDFYQNDSNSTIYYARQLQ